MNTNSKIYFVLSGLVVKVFEKRNMYKRMNKIVVLFLKFHIPVYSLKPAITWIQLTEPNLFRTLTIQHAMNDKEIGYDEYALVKPYDYYAPVYSYRDSDSQYSR